MFTTHISFLSHHWIWGTDNLFSSFTGPLMEGNFAPEWIIHRVSIIPELDDLDGKIWVFSTDDI